MLTALVFCPHPPVLVPEVAQGASPELDDLRAACRAALRGAVGHGDPRLVLVGGSARSDVHEAADPGTLAGFGIPLTVSLDGQPTRAPTLPLSLTVGAWLVLDALGPRPDATALSVGPDWDGSPAARAWNDVCADPRPTTAVVLGDGSARRSTAAPGYLDGRAEPHDRAIAAGLAAGDPSALAAVDPDGLLVAGTAAWRVVAAAARAGDWTAELTYDAAPYGVGYFVATWRSVDGA